MPSVVFAFQRPDGKIAMERRTPTDTYFPNEWVIPGGKIDPGEVPSFALLREIGEELGVVPQAIYYLETNPPIYYLNRVDARFQVFPYLITEWDGVMPDHILDSGNPVDWFSVSTMILSPVPATVAITSLIYAHNHQWVRKPRA